VRVEISKALKHCGAQPSLEARPCYVEQLLLAPGCAFAAISFFFMRKAQEGIGIRVKKRGYFR